MVYQNEEKILEEREAWGVPYLVYPLLEQTGIVTHGFSTRMGGVSQGPWTSMNLSSTRGDDPAAVAENKRRMAKALGVRPEDLTYTHQTHTTNVAVVKKEDRGRRFMETDGMVTDVPGICLVTFYADCVPLYFVDPVRRCIGLSHAGWRGTAGKIGKKTVELMREQYGTRPSDLAAAIGPSICQDCYEVSQDVIEAFQEAFEERFWPELFYAKENGKYQLNLWRANELTLLEAGLKPERIAVTDLCTCCNPALLFSHRASHGKRGNLGAFLMLR